MLVRSEALAVVYDGDDTLDANREERLLDYTHSEFVDEFVRIAAICDDVAESELAADWDPEIDEDTIESGYTFRDEAVLLDVAA